MTVHKLITLLQDFYKNAEVVVMCPSEDGVEWYPFPIDTVQSTDNDETVIINVKDI